MKIDYAIMSCNDDPIYFEFWGPVSRCWESLGITPILFYFGNKEINDDKIIKIDYIDGFPHALQCIWSRFYFLKLLDFDRVSIISDIDMIPLSSKYFIENIKHYDENYYIHINPCISTYGRLPACYHIGKNKTFINNIELDKFISFEDSLKECIKYAEWSNGWFAEENFTTKMLQKNNQNLILLERDGGQNGHRIDRCNNDNWSSSYNLEMIKNEEYYDCHSIRPYSKFKQEIDTIVSAFLNRKK